MSSSHQNDRPVRKKKKKKKRSEQHSPPLHINQKANKTSARSTASSMKSLGSTGSYNLNYQKQKRGMRNKNGKRK